MVILYNEEQKNKYLKGISEDNEKHVKSVLSLFNNIAGIEDDLGLDFSQLDKENTIEVLAQISGRKKATKSWNISVLKDYNNFCKYNMWTDDNALEGVSYTDIDSSKAIRVETIPNIEYLRRVLEVGLPEINNDVSMNTIYRLYAYLLYSGLTEQEIVSITKDEAKVGNGDTIRYNGKEIYIQPFLKKVLNHVRSTDEIVWIKGYGGVNYINLAPSNYLIGAVRALDNRLGNFKNIVSKVNKLYIKETGKYIRLSASRIYESGVFYRTLQSELDAGKIDEKIIIDAFDIREEKYTTQSIYQMQVYNAKKDYEAWKKAWHYE